MARYLVSGGSILSQIFKALKLIVTSTQAFLVGDAANDANFIVDTVNSRVGVNTGSGFPDASLGVSNTQASGDPAFDIYYRGTADAGIATLAFKIDGHQTANAMDGVEVRAYNRTIATVLISSVTGLIGFGSGGVFGFSSTAAASTTLDAAFSRIAAGIIGVGTGAQGSFAGSLKLTDLNITGSGTNGNVYSGVYTPVATNPANMSPAPTMYQAQYMRVGNTVTVSGKFTADAVTTLVTTSFEMSIPIASNFGVEQDAGGVAATYNDAQPVSMSANAPNNTIDVYWTPISTAQRNYFFTFTYRVI